MSWWAWFLLGMMSGAIIAAVVVFVATALWMNPWKNFL